MSVISNLSAHTGVALVVNILGFTWLGCTASGQLLPVLVPAVTSASVASSTFPATVALAFGVAPVALCTHAPAT